jgi:hypothetical protein
VIGSQFISTSLVLDMGSLTRAVRIHSAAQGLGYASVAPSRAMHG